MKKAMLAAGSKRKANTTLGPAVMVEYVADRQNVHLDVDKLARNVVTEEVGENIEYLDEVAGDEYVPMLTSTHNECIEPDEEEEDTFYPNAVHCLIALYRANRQKTHSNGVRTNWEDIARQMRDSYFEFDCDQVRRKFDQLRRLYYVAAAAGDGCEEFEYFDQMHQLEQAKLLEDQSQNLQVLTVVYTGDGQSYLTLHADAENAHKAMESVEMKKRQRHMEAIKPKAKQTTRQQTLPQETRAVEVPFEQCPEQADDDTINIKIEQQETSPIQLSPTMRRYKSLPPLEHEPLASKRMSLAEYDAHQERRHQEKIALMHSGLKLQERNIAMQRQLMEEIIKRM